LWNGLGACILPVGMERRIALSVRQPWAELILRGDKAVEYRGRPTRRRGRVYLYASTLPAEAAAEWERLALRPADLPAGVIVGSVEIVGCEGSNGDYRWLLARPRRLARPLRPRGRPQPIFFYPF